jgi:hypothetical protein
MTPEVVHDPARSRYELHLDGEVIGVADYVVRGDVALMVHTEVRPDQRGKDYAEMLVRGALDDLRRAGLSIEPRCWYVADFVDSHPEYADPVAERTSRQRTPPRLAAPADGKP